MGDIYIAAHLRRCLRHSVFGHVLQYTPSTSVLDALHLHHAIKSPPLRYPSPLHIAFIEVKNELVKTKNVFPMKVNTHTITHQKKKTNIDTHIIMYQANFAGGRSRLDLLLPSFLPSREEKKIQDRKNRPLGCRGVSNTPHKHLGRDEQKIQDRKNRPLGSRGVLHTPHIDRVRTETKMQEQIFCPLRGHAVGRMQYAPTSCRQETLYLINSQEERIETKMQERRKQSIDNGAEWHTPHTERIRIETKMQEQFFCPLWGHAVGRMQYAPTSCRQEMLFPINFQEERTETKMQEQKNHPSGSRGVLHTPYTDRVRIETKTQEQIFCPLRGHAVGRMQYAPTSCRQERLFPINSQEERTETKMQRQKNHPSGSRGVLHTPYTDYERTETKMQEQKNHPLGSRGVLHTPHMDRVRIETKKQEQKNHPSGSRGVLHTPHMNRERIKTKTQEQIFCPLRGHVAGRMQYAPTSCRQERLFPINSREERTETKMQEQKNHPSDSGAEWHTSHMDLVRIETKMQERIFCPLRGHSVGRMQYAPTSCRQGTLFPINSQEERIETKMQEQKSRPSGSRGVLHTPHMDRVRIETKMQEQIFCPLRGHVVGRMQYAPTSCRQERLFPINSQEERIETKMQERRKQSINNGAEWHTPFMRHGERDVVWREAFLKQRVRVAVWRDRRLEEISSHARLQLKTSGENSKPYKSSLVALSEQLRDIFAA